VEKVAQLMRHREPSDAVPLVPVPCGVDQHVSTSTKDGPEHGEKQVQVHVTPGIVVDCRIDLIRRLETGELARWSAGVGSSSLRSSARLIRRTVHAGSSSGEAGGRPSWLRLDVRL
jgi:hypothetical protein